jgi:hypothetical protein
MKRLLYKDELYFFKCSVDWLDQTHIKVYIVNTGPFRFIKKYKKIASKTFSYRCTFNIKRVTQCIDTYLQSQKQSIIIIDCSEEIKNLYT